MTENNPNILSFPGPPSKKDVHDRIKQEGWESGAILTVSEYNTDIVIFGSPTSAELLWLSEQLRMKALYNDD